MYHFICTVFLIITITVVVYLMCFSASQEDYSLSYFPWNEANLVKKSIPTSTVRCKWCLKDDSFQSPWTIRENNIVFYQ
jgi:hypothetical protein